MSLTRKISESKKSQRTDLRNLFQVRGTVPGVPGRTNPEPEGGVGGEYWETLVDTGRTLHDRSRDEDLVLVGKCGGRNVKGEEVSEKVPTKRE